MHKILKCTLKNVCAQLNTWDRNGASQMFYAKVKFTTCLVLCLCLTLSLHARSDEGERVGRQLSAGAGHRAAAHQHHDARVGRALRVPLQPGVLQRLREEDSMRKSLNEGIILNTHTHTHTS